MVMTTIPFTGDVIICSTMNEMLSKYMYLYDWSYNYCYRWNTTDLVHMIMMMYECLQYVKSQLHSQPHLKLVLQARPNLYDWTSSFNHRCWVWLLVSACCEELVLSSQSLP